MINLDQFETEEQVRAWAKPNGYSADGVEKLLERWRNRDKVEEVEEKEDQPFTSDFREE